jgi:cytochrome c oxidase cbb3-type subunit 2
MPNYPWLKESEANPSIGDHMKGLQSIGVPYTDADIAAAGKEVEGKTEEDAMVAYLQVLGTMAKLDEDKVYRE